MVLGKVEARWFAGSLTNICYNALDRNIALGLLQATTIIIIIIIIYIYTYISN